MRKVGGEAPAAKVLSSEGEAVIGMIAVRVQLIVYTKNLSMVKEMINSLEGSFLNEEKLLFIAVSDDSMESIETFQKENKIEKCQIYSDQFSQFSSKFKIAENELGVFLIDKEGVFEYVYYGNVKELNLQKVVEQSLALANKKQKGHTHENWMR